MEKAFWQQRWQQGEIGFHLDRVNPNLVAYSEVLALTKGSRVLVPLCGKTLDMLWLAQRGIDVIGVEICEEAVAAFFAESGLSAQRQRVSNFTVWHGGAIRIFCGDFFELEATDCGHFDAVYDRAALVALPPAMRQRYSQRLIEVAPCPLRCLLVTLDYPRAQMDGPPFAVTPEEVRQLFGETVPIRLLADEDVLPAHPHFRERGLTGLRERVYYLGYPYSGTRSTGGAGLL